MAEPGSTRVQAWRAIMTAWFQAASAWLAVWTVEGAGDQLPRFWSFFGEAWVPFSNADAPVLSRALSRDSPSGEVARLHRSMWELRRRDGWSQVGAALQVGLGTAHGWDGPRRTERGVEWHGLLGDANPRFRPAPEAYPGMGIEECARRLKEFVQDVLLGTVMPSPRYQVDFLRRRFVFRFQLLLPYSSDHSWVSEGRGLTREEYVVINMTPRDVAEPRPTAEAETQVDETLPGVSDDQAVHREITTILVERDQVGLPEVSVVEERAAELTSARHEREAVEARCQAVIRSRQFDLMTNDEGDVRGRPTRRMTNVGVGMDREEEHADP